MATKLAVVGLDPIVPLLREAGFKLVTQSTDATDVVKAVREADGPVKVIMRATDDARIQSWAQQFTNKSLVVVKTVDDPDMGFDVPVVTLPAPMNTITATLGAPPRPGGDREVAVLGDEPEDDWGLEEEEEFEIEEKPDAFAEKPDAKPDVFAEKPDAFGNAEKPDVFGNAEKPDVFETPDVFPHQDRPAGAKCPVVVVWSGKGGVGKSGSALALAAQFAERTDKRVIAVDMNRGQGDARKFMRLSMDKSLLTIYDAYVQGNPRAAIMSPQAISEARHSILPDVKFGMVFAPRPGQTDPRAVTAEFYRAVIDQARQVADLVVVDTQIVEDSDTSGLIDGVAIPLVQGRDGWGLAVSDASTAGVENTLRYIPRFSAPERMMFFLNRLTADSGLRQETLERQLHGGATLMGMVPMDHTVVNLTNAGQFANAFGPMKSVLDKVLLRVTGDTVFDQPEPQPQKRRLWPFGRR